jgi:hypothetical protein
MEPLHNSSFLIHNSSAVAVYYWRGARPWLLDLTADDTGWLVCLCLQREGDVALLPLAWEQNAPAADDAAPSSFAPRPSSFHGDALDAEAYQLTLHDLESDGWQVTGRLTLDFTGAEKDELGIMNYEENSPS